MQFIKRPSWVKPFENKYINHIIRYHGGCHFSFLSKNMVVENYHKYYSTVPYSNKELNFMMDIGKPISILKTFVKNCAMNFLQLKR